MFKSGIYKCTFFHYGKFCNRTTIIIHSRANAHSWITAFLLMRFIFYIWNTRVVLLVICFTFQSKSFDSGVQSKTSSSDVTMTTSTKSSSPKKSDGKKVKIATSDGRQVFKHWLYSIEYAFVIFVSILVYTIIHLWQ